MAGEGTQYEVADAVTAPHPERGSSRRAFLRRTARGALGVAAIELLPAEALANSLALPVAPVRADESYWHQVQAQFPLRGGILPLNAANLAPAPRPVIDAVASTMRDLEGDVSFQNRVKFDELRERVRDRLAAVLGASPDEIAIVRNTSEANNVVVAGLSLRAGDEVLIFDQNHATNAVAWDVRGARQGFAVRRVAIDDSAVTPEQVVDVFRRALSPRTRVLAFSDVSNVTGIRLPSKALCALARERGIHTHIDGAQTFGALVRDLHDIGCDSYAASAHKWLMGPKEAGVLFVRADRIADVWPNVVGVGWGDQVETQAKGARKFETLGQRNDATTAGLGAALRFYELIGPARLEARILELASMLFEGMARMPGATLVTPTSPELHAGVVIARFDGADNRRLYERLYDEHGISGAATGGLRLCPHVYATATDIERTIVALHTLLRRAD